jgi:hypothetical protein
MPFDPALPAQGSELQSGVIRGQFTALFDLIQAIVSVVAVQVDGVTTLPPGSNANVTVSISGGTLHFTFGIPQGPDGPCGADGGEGPQGPPFASAIVDGVATLDPGSDATVEASFDGTDVHFTFGIPRGNDGANGADGGEGPPGEVSAQQLDDAIATTAQNPNGLGPFGGDFSDPPTQGELQDFAAYVESLRAALVR